MEGKRNGGVYMHIEVSGVSKQFGDKMVLLDVSLQVAKGQFIALLGPSGCGKTTLLNALAGLLSIDGGTISVDGKVFSSNQFTLRPELRNIGMVFQDFALWPHMTVYDNVAFGLRVKRMSKVAMQNRVREVLQTVRMDAFAERYPHELSGGQKQRVAIARALAPEPAVLLMDEPLSSLDAKLREQMRWELLRILQGAGITTVYVTHDQVEALSMADHIVLLNQGRIEQEGPPTQLYEHPTTTFSAAFLGASNLLPGTVVRAGEEVGVVNSAGLELQAQTSAEVGEEVIVFVRPAEIQILTPGVVPKTGVMPGVQHRGIVQQRAFQGTTWQYRVALEQNPSIVLEIWDAQAHAIGAWVDFFIPLGKCRTVLNSESKESRHMVH